MSDTNPTSNQRLSDANLRYNAASGVYDVASMAQELLEWRAGCTGKHGSQMPCVLGDGSAHETAAKQPNWEAEYRKLAGVYTREGLEKFIADYWPGNKLADVSAVEPKPDSITKVWKRFARAFNRLQCADIPRGPWHDEVSDLLLFGDLPVKTTGGVSDNMRTALADLGRSVLDSWKEKDSEIVRVRAELQHKDSVIAGMIQGLRDTTEQLCPGDCINVGGDPGLVVYTPHVLVLWQNKRTSLVPLSVITKTTAPPVGIGPDDVTEARKLGPSGSISEWMLEQSR